MCKSDIDVSYYRTKYDINPNNSITDLDIDKIKSMYQVEMLSDRQISEIYRCNQSTIGRFRVKYGIATIHRETKLQNKLTKEILIDMYVNKQMTDKQIAAELGCRPANIQKYRAKYKIASLDRNSDIHQKLTKEVLFDLYVNKQMTDKQISEELNCSEVVVNLYRTKYGIHSIDRRNDTQKQLTKEVLFDLYVNKQMTDKQIAEQFNYSSGANIYKQRMRYGIATIKREKGLQETLSKEKLTDMYINKQMTDVEIAKELGCTTGTVRTYRNKYNIATNIKKTALQEKLTAETLTDMYVNKQMTDSEIAKELGCRRTVVCTYRNKYGIDTIDRNLELHQKLTKEVLVDMYINKQMTDKQIAKELGCTQSTVSKYRAKHGIKTKNNIISVSQQEVYDIVCEMFIQANKKPPEIIMCDKLTIPPFEIDILLPEHKLGIEFNGGFWHSEVKHDKKYHYNKSALAHEKGIFIYHIFSYEWEDCIKRQKIKNQIQNLLGLNATKIYARKCDIREVVPKEKSRFLDANHVQGNDRSSLNLGLYYNDELVSLMTFTKPRFNRKCNWELSRFCSKAGCNIIGGASKLFKYFVDKHMCENESIISYSDIAKTKGNLYGNLGFEFSHISEPNYVWWKCDTDYKTRYQCQMKNEVQIMQDQKYYRIYDCGNKAWIYTKK